MFHRLLEHVIECPPQEVADLSIQDMAICVAWYESYARQPEQQAPWTAIPTVRDRWLADVGQADLQTEGRRNQTVLRTLMDVVLSGQMVLLQRDELDFLLTVHTLADRTARSSLFERIRGLLAPYAEAMATRRNALSHIPGLPTISAQFHVITAEDIESAPVRDIKLFAGLALPGRGPVLALSGHVKVLDSVPEKCMVVVEEGACAVDGYVMGRIAARDSCEVRENISGVVITRKGDIRCRSIINNALVVSKLGSVFCYSAQQPELVFAGTQVRISSTSLMGRYIAPRIQVIQHVFGGEYHVSEFLIANLFRRSDARPLSIVLRAELGGGEDYGEQISDDAERLMARGARYRERLTTLAEMIQGVERELEHQASSMLLYLCGGDNARAQLQAVQAAQRRLSVLSRIIAGMRILSRDAEKKLSVRLRPALEFAESDSDSYALLEAEIRELESEGSLDPDLARERTELAEMRIRIEVQSPNQHLTSTLLTRLQEREAEWVAERNRLLKEVSVMESEVQGILDGAQAVSGQEGSISRIQLLTQMLGTIRLRPANDIMQTRLQSTFARLMMRSITTRLERVKTQRANQDQVRSEYNETITELRERYQVPWGSLLTTHSTDEKNLPRVTGRFDAGIKVCSDPYFLTVDDAPPKFVVITPDKISDHVTTYVRRPQGRIEA